MREGDIPMRCALCPSGTKAKEIWKVSCSSGLWRAISIIVLSVLISITDSTVASPISPANGASDISPVPLPGRFMELGSALPWQALLGTRPASP